MDSKGLTCKYWAQISKLRTKEEDSLPAEDCWSQNDEANNNAWNFDYIYLFICVQVFVHFGASWCVPSLAMNSFFEELALTYQDILFLVVDVDEVKGVASKMEVKAMPTFVLMRDGAVLDKIVGANPEEIRKRIDGFVQSFRRPNMVD